MPRPATVRAVTDEPEQAGRVVTIDYEGHTYTYDLDKVEIQALEDYDDGKYLPAIRSILGAEQWATYKARHPLGRDLDRFIAALLAATGQVGNPSASSAS